MTNTSNAGAFGKLLGTSLFGQNHPLSGGTLTSTLVGAQNAVHTLTGAQNAVQQSAMYNSMPKNSMTTTSNKRIFTGNIEVSQVANGYMINIGTREGYEYTTYIAHSIVEVNEIIAAAMVAFQLEN